MHSTKIKLNIKNIRDLGGIKTKDGNFIKEHLLIRSEKLSSLSKEEMYFLYEKYNLRKIYDFRNSAEFNEDKDTIIEGIEYINHQIQKDDNYAFSKDEESIKRQKEYFDNLKKKYKNDYDGLIKHMRSFYKELANDPYVTRRYISFIKDLYASKGACLYHCSLGKDRAGIATVMILELLGVSRKTIYEDYLYTNDCFNISFPLDNVIEYMDVAMKEYLDAYYEEIENNYHSYHEFLNKNGLDDKFIDHFRTKYLTFL